MYCLGITDREVGASQADLDTFTKVNILFIYQQDVGSGDDGAFKGQIRVNTSGRFLMRSSH